jgi:hypothetical protein
MTDNPQTGVTLILADKDYKYGVGPILCRVKLIIEPQNYGDGVRWWRVVGECAEGVLERHSSWRERELYIREPAFTQRTNI